MPPTKNPARSFNRKAAVRSNLRAKRRGSFKRTEACVLARAGMNIVFTGTSLQTAKVLRNPERNRYSAGESNTLIVCWNRWSNVCPRAETWVVIVCLMLERVM